MAVSPGGIYVNSANAELFSQMCARRADFTKPTEVYEVVNLFGANVLSAEGQAWREHRRVTAPAFSERNHALVWRESLRQADAMLASWGRRGSNSFDDMHIGHLQPDAATLSLHVISKAGFGIPLFWPGESVTLEDDNGLAHFSTHEALKGHSLTFKTALNTILSNILWFTVFSPGLLLRMPFNMARRAGVAWAQCSQYWGELLKRKMEDVRSGDSDRATMDLMVRLVEASEAVKAMPKGGDDEAQTVGAGLTADEIIGNAFIFMVAGHETVANTLHHAILGLAINRAAQRELQKDVDEILGTESVKDCAYEEYYDRLYGSTVGAVVNESLRLIPPIMVIPKTARAGAQHVTVDGRSLVIPDGTFLRINVVAVHRNPRYWPHGPSTRTGKADDLDDFVPGRWAVDDADEGVGKSERHDKKADGAPRAPANVYNPPRGAFVPFSDGSRGCLGRRFALAELVAVLAAVFRSYSVELAVDRWAGDAELARMTPRQRAAVYQKAVDNAYRSIDDGCESILTLKIRREYAVPVRFRPRGQELFEAA